MAVRNLIVAALLFALAAPSPGAPPGPADEIEYLMATIGSSGCEFVRNGKRHGAREAEAHIRMKYRRARRYATTAERFIERLASKSSLSGRPYLMDCPGSPAVPSADWLGERLAAFRDRADDAARREGNDR